MKVLKTDFLTCIDCSFVNSLLIDLRPDFNTPDIVRVYRCGHRDNAIIKDTNVIPKECKLNDK